MLIQDQHKPQRRRALLRLVFLLGALVLFLLLITLLPEPSPYQDLPEEQIYCGAEKVRGDKFWSNGISFDGGRTQSAGCGRYGRYGSKLPTNDTIQEGISYTLTQPRPGQAFRASVWYRTAAPKAAFLAAAVSGSAPHRWATNEAVGTDSLGWSQLVLYCYIPYGKSNTSLRIFTYSTGAAPVCFDDLLIEPIPEPSHFQLPRIDIQVDTKKPLALPATCAKVAAKIQTDQAGALSAFLTRIPGSKASFRLQLLSDSQWNKLHHFTLRPVSRREEAEAWVLHQLWAKAGLLTTRYDFTEVYYNGRSLGLYTYEEALDSHFVYRNPYPEGPIVQISGFAESPYPIIQSVNTPGDSLPGPQQQIVQARRLVTQYQAGDALLPQVVEVEQLALHFAIASLLGTRLPPAQKWYYNPTIDQLLPIAWGCPETISSPQPLLRRLMREEAFTAPYLSALYRWSGADSVSTLLDPLTAGWEARAIYAQRALPDTLYSMSGLRQRIQAQRKRLLPHSPYTITAYTQSVRGPVRQLSVLNQHHLPLLVAGYGRSSKSMQAGLETPELLWPAAWQTADADALFTRIDVGTAATHLFYRLPGVDRLFASPIIPSPAPVESTDWQQLLGKAEPKPDKTYTVSKQRVVFPAGSHLLQASLVVPADHTLVLEAGAEIVLDQRASILSLGPVQARGRADRPVKIKATYSGGGVAVLQAVDTSNLQYVLMENLQPPAFKGWQLSAGFTLYESDAVLQNCAWLKGRGDAAVQSVRSWCKVRDCLVSEAAQNGWAVDYSRAAVQDCRFEQCGKDGLTMNGSRFNLDNGSFRGNARYGIHTTARSRLQAKGGMIANSPTALGASDGARVNWQGLRLIDCPIGFAAFQKKPEFGPARITITDLEADAVDQLQNTSGSNRITIN